MKDTRRKKRISLTVEAEPYEDLRRLGDLAGFNPDWISLELNRMIKALRSVAQQAIEDSKTKREMTEEQARKRYEDLMRKSSMKISLICSQRNKKALLGSLAATGRLLSKARAELCSCHASQLAYVI